MSSYFYRTVPQTICLIIFVLGGGLCSTIETNDKKEGLVNETLFRVYVRIEFLEINDTINDSDLNKFIIEKGKKRFEVIWNDIILINGKDISDSLYNSIDTGKIYYKKEREEYIEAYVDFKMGNKALEFYKKVYSPVISGKGDDD